MGSYARPVRQHCRQWLKHFAAELSTPKETARFDPPNHTWRPRFFCVFAEIYYLARQLACCLAGTSLKRIAFNSQRFEY